MIFPEITKDFNKMVQYCAETFTVFPSWIKGRKSDRNCTNCRIAIITLLYSKYRDSGITLQELGRMVNKDHSTVIHYLRRHEAIYNFPFWKAYTRIFNELSNLINYELQDSTRNN